MAHSIIGKGALVLCALASSLGASAAQADDLKITGLSLFSFQKDLDPPLVPVKQDGVIPYRVDDSCYGWLLLFEPVDGPVVLHEVLTIPGPAERWNTDDESTVAADRKSASTTITVEGREGMAEHTWCVVEGDPEGSYSFSISREGETRAANLRFRLERQ